METSYAQFEVCFCIKHETFNRLHTQYSMQSRPQMIICIRVTCEWSHMNPNFSFEEHEEEILAFVQNIYFNTRICLSLCHAFYCKSYTILIYSYNEQDVKFTFKNDQRFKNHNMQWNLQRMITSETTEERSCTCWRIKKQMSEWDVANAAEWST